MKNLTAVLDALDLAIERRIVVKGWKVHVPYGSTTSRRDWQPHITSVVIEERVVSAWAPTDRVEL